MMLFKKFKANKTVFRIQHFTSPRIRICILV